MDRNSFGSVIFSDKAYLGIVAETFEKVRTETGGIFLGKYFEENWYIIETLDPGPKSIFEPAYFEYDTPYVNHLANKVARFYINSLELIGLWHRHPGGFSSFSSTDNSTNIKYAQMCANGAISALVNLDPDFRLSIYHVSIKLDYIKLGFQVGDSRIPSHLLEYKKDKDFIPSRNTVIQTSEKNLSNLSLPNQQKMIDHKKRSSFFPVFFRKSNEHKNTQEKNINSTSTDQITPSRVSSNISLKNDVLNMVESEITYLETQLDYDFKMKMINDFELLVTMDCRQSISGYPMKLQFIFGMNHQKLGYVKINQKQKMYKYFPDFIHTYINRNISQY